MRLYIYIYMDIYSLIYFYIHIFLWPHTLMDAFTFMPMPLSRDLCVGTHMTSCFDRATSAHMRISMYMNLYLYIYFNIYIITFVYA